MEEKLTASELTFLARHGYGPSDQIDRQAEKFLEILAGKIKSPAGHEVRFCKLLHFDRSRRRNVGVEEPPAPPFGLAGA